MSLPAPPSASDSLEAKVVTGLGGYPYKKPVECVGRAYHRRLRNLLRGRTVSQDSVEGTDEKAAARAAEEAALAKYRKYIKGKNFVDLTMYEQLGLQKEGFDATEEQIRKNYYRVLIEHHPDKTGKSEKDPNYLAVQKAFKTLTDPQRRRAYDSQCDFDDWIPTGRETIKQNSPDNEGKDFYKLYGDVFRRNARFSEKKPVPTLGDDSTDLDTVYKFYDFWVKFDSWRDFTHNAEHDLDNADHRDEKRWMMKKNEAAAKKQKKKEYARLTNLVDRAMANDPRIVRSKRAEKEKKLKAKQDKEAAEAAAKKAIEDAAAEEQRKIEEAEAAKKAASKDAKLARDKAKKLFRKVKKLFRELMEKARDNGEGKALDLEDTEDICDSNDIDQVTALNKALGGSVDAFNKAGLDAVLESLKKIKGEDYVAGKYN